MRHILGYVWCMPPVRRCLPSTVTQDTHTSATVKMPSRLKTGQQQQDTGKDTELLCCYWCCWAACGVSYRRTSGVLLYYSLPYSFETGPLTEPGTRPVTNPSDPPVCLPQSWGYMWPHLAFHMGAGDLNSGSLCLHSKYSYPPSHLPSSN